MSSPPEPAPLMSRGRKVVVGFLALAALAGLGLLGLVLAYSHPHLEAYADSLRTSHRDLVEANGQQAAGDAREGIGEGLERHHRAMREAEEKRSLDAIEEASSAAQKEWSVGVACGAGGAGFALLGLLVWAGGRRRKAGA